MNERDWLYVIAAFFAALDCFLGRALYREKKRRLRAQRQAVDAILDRKQARKELTGTSLRLKASTRIVAEDLATLDIRRAQRALRAVARGNGNGGAA